MCERFFGIPQSAVRLGKVKELSPIAVKLYIALWHESERYSTRELTRTTAQVQALVGGSPNSHTKARDELAQAGLVVAEPYGAAGFVFVLCDPETGKPWPFPPKEKLQYQKKGTSSAAAPQSTVKSERPPKIGNAGTSFPFGWNVSNSPTAVPSVQRTTAALNWEGIF
jgi:hypothetical protein